MVIIDAGILGFYNIAWGAAQNSRKGLMGIKYFLPALKVINWRVAPLIGKIR